MEALIDPVDYQFIEKELNIEKFLRGSSMGKNEIYEVNGITSPFTMNEIGRLRELTFRHAGGGTGASKDIDQFDIKKNGYKQLIVWDVYNLSEEFQNEYLQHSIDLGRAFIKPLFQTKQKRKNLYILDNLWDGLGALINQQSKYFLGRIVLYPQMDKKIRDLIIYFLEKHYNRGSRLLTAKSPFHPEMDKQQMEQLLDEKNPEGDFKNLRQIALAAGEAIPPLIQAYMKLSPTMQSFGATIDTSFGNLYEICIMVTIQDIYPKYLKRYSVIMY